MRDDRQTKSGEVTFNGERVIQKIFFGGSKVLRMLNAIENRLKIGVKKYGFCCVQRNVIIASVGDSSNSKLKC